MIYGGMCGVQRVPRGCDLWRAVWGALGCTGGPGGCAVWGPYGVLCLALWCRGCPRCCAIWKGVWVAPACGGCHVDGCVGCPGLCCAAWDTLGAVLRDGVCAMLCVAVGCMGWPCVCALWSALGLCWGHWVPGGWAVWVAVRCSTRMLWGLGCMSRCVERSVLRCTDVL